MSKRSRNDIINDLLCNIAEEKNTITQIIFYTNISFTLFKEILNQLTKDELIYETNEKYGIRRRKRWFLTSKGLKLYDIIKQYQKARGIERIKRY